MCFKLNSAHILVKLVGKWSYYTPENVIYFALLLPQSSNIEWKKYIYFLLIKASLFNS